MPVFKLDDDDTILIRTIDAHEEAMAMARRLGVRGVIRTMVGKWEENGQMIGFTKQSKDGDDDVLVEVFISKADEENREFNRYAVEMTRLIEENKALKAKLREPA